MKQWWQNKIWKCRLIISGKSYCVIKEKQLEDWIQGTLVWIKRDAGQKPDYNAELLSWEHSFTPAINMYLRDELGYKTDLNYYIFGPVQPWDNSNNNTGDDLRMAMMENPYLNLLVQSGYYDGACDYFNAKYNMWQMDPAGKIQDRMFWEGYRSGHMMYLRKEDLSTSNDHLRVFIKNSIPKPGVPAKF
jgi:carboxypeptidase C (cathepsin A)